jgi:hypothetical protein
VVKLAADGTKQWDKTYGGTYNEYMPDVVQTPDGGYIIGGNSYSEAGADKSEDSGGGIGEDRMGDFWILKLSSDGNLEWERTAQVAGDEILRGIRPTSDGGYLAWGTYYIVKFSSTGIKLWDYLDATGIGLNASDSFETPDGGFIIGSAGAGGYRIVKLFTNGSVEWDKTYVGSAGFSVIDPDNLAVIRMTSDGGYLVGGRSYFNAGGDKSENSRGGYDYWILKINADGTKIWDKTFGGSGTESLSGINETSDGGFLLVGMSNSDISGDKSTALQGRNDAWIVKITSDGTMEWDRSLGGQAEAFLSLINQDANGNYLLAGFTFGGAGGFKTANFAGNWQIKLSSNGDKIWDYTVPVSSFPSSVSTTKDGGYIVGGTSSANAGGIKTENAKGGLDYWIVKFAPEDPLPVSLTTFIIQKEFNTTNLTWQTTSETRSNRFEVEHSTSGKSWNQIGTLSTKGESSELQTYQFIHVSPVSGDNYYRLKMIDRDGSFTFSKVKYVKFDLDFDVIVYPNPVIESIHLKVDWSKVVRVQVLNSLGEILYESEQKATPEINTKAFKAGMYFVKVILADGTETIRKVMIGK